MAMRLRGERGLGLVELMVAIALSLGVLLTLGYLFVGGRQTYRVQDGLARIQENARYAIEFLAREIRMAGYMGCANFKSITPVVIANEPPAFGPATSLIGYDNALGWSAPTGFIIERRDGTDVITISMASSASPHLVGNTDPVNANVQVNSNPEKIKQGDVVFITDCSAADIFRVTNEPVIDPATSPVTITHAGNFNTPNKLSKVYGTDATLMMFKSETFLIGINPAGNPSLYRIPFLGSPGKAEELVENVENMQISYGVDTNDDNAVDEYVSASSVGNWAKVYSVRIELLFRGNEDNVTTQPQAYVFNGAMVTPTDRRQRYALSTTVTVRNRAP